MRLGFVGLDTSHPESWLPIEREMGCVIAGFVDEAEIHPPEYARAFAQKCGLRQFSTVRELVDAVDVGIIHSCNWDRHIEQAQPFVEAGKGVFIDKPMAGNAKDIGRLTEWADSGARITGGSCFLGCREIRDWQEASEATNEKPHTVIAGCAVDEFNYAIHAYAMASAVFGTGIRRVRTLGETIQRQVQIEWQNGGCGILVVGSQKKWLQAHVTIITETSAVQMRPGTDRLYDAYVQESLAYLFGRTDSPRVPFRQAIECDSAALAAELSSHEEGRWVDISEIQDSSVSYDGKAFASAYRAQKYPSLS